MTSVDSRRDSPAVQRRSSSAVTATPRQSVSCRNSLPVSLSGAKSHKSLERKRPSEGGLKKYSGSHSTSSIPRKVVKENAEKLKAIRKVSDDSNAETDTDDNFGPVTSILSFVDQPPGGHGGRGPGDARKQSIIHGLDEHEVKSEASSSQESRNNTKNQHAPVSAGKNENVKKPVIKKKDESKASSKSAPAAKAAKPSPPAKPTSRPSTPAAKTSTGSVKSSSASASATLRTKKQPLKQSVTAPLSERPRTPGLKPQLRATKSNTAPVTQMASKRTPGDLGTPRPASAASSAPSTPAGRPVRGAGAGGASQKSANQVNTLPKTGSQSKNTKAQSKASPYPKKVSSEYASEIVFKNQEGLKFSSVSFFDEEVENGQSRYDHHTSHLPFLTIPIFSAGGPAPPSARGCLVAPAPRQQGQPGRGTRARSARCGSSSRPTSRPPWPRSLTRSRAATTRGSQSSEVR